MKTALSIRLDIDTLNNLKTKAEPSVSALLNDALKDLLANPPIIKSVKTTVTSITIDKDVAEDLHSLALKLDVPVIAIVEKAIERFNLREEAVERFRQNETS